MAITKPPVLPAWADAGDKVQPSNAELSVGWPVSSTPPSRQRFNWVLNFVANAVRYFSRRGLVDYDAAETYMTGDRVIGDDGKTYRSLVDNNTAQTPSTSPAKWERWGFSQSDLGANAQTQPYTAFTTTGVTGAFVLTPSPALTAYTANQRFRVKFHAVGNGSDTLAVSGLAAKSLKQYDFTGSKVAAAVAANQLVDVEYDGVDFVLLDPYPQAGLSFRNALRSVGTTSTLLATDVGSSIELNGSGITVTLPAIASTPLGGTITCRTNYDCTLKGNAAENISSVSGPVNTYAMYAGDTVTLVNIGSSWYVVSAGFGTPSFNRSLSSSGYVKLPGGVIIQWGTVTHPGNSTSVAYSLPITFPNFFSSIVGIEQGATPTIGFSFTKQSLGSYGLTSSYTGGNNTFSFIAIGY